MTDEARKLLERLRAPGASTADKMRVYEDIDAFLAQPIPATREAALLERGEAMARSQDWILAGFPEKEDYQKADAAIKAWIKVAADTSPAAAALLAELEQLRHKVQRALIHLETSSASVEAARAKLGEESK